MSCEACDKNTEPCVYYRWRNANIGVRGCDRHVKEVFAMLDHVQASLGHDEMEKLFETRMARPLVKVKARPQHDGQANETEFEAEDE